MPVARITMSAVSDCPSDSSTAFVPSASRRIRCTPAPQWTGMFRAASQRCAWSAAAASSIRGSTCVSRSTTASCHFRLYIALRTMKPMKPAPTSTTRGVRPAGCSDAACFSTRSVCASDQSGVTPGRSAPGIDGRSGDEPVAISSVSKPSVLPSVSVTNLRCGSTAATRMPNRVATFSRAKYAASPVCVCTSGMAPASQYGSAMRECAGSSQTSVMSDRPPSNCRIVSTALVAAGPPPMMT